MSDPFAPVISPLETQSLFTLLGIRFWDPAANQPVTDDLLVTAWPDGRPQSKATAFRTASGIYAFRRLPGMYDLEVPAGTATPWDEEVTPTRFIFEPADLRRRYLTLAYAVDVPFRGVFPTDLVTSPGAERAPGVWLFSAPTRPAMPALALMRAQLLIADPNLPSLPDPPQPAAYAVMILEIDGESWHGVAGADGQVALFFPYPDFTSPVGFESPLTAMPPQSWSGDITVLYQPGAQAIPAGASAPDVRSLFNQAPADLWLDETGLTSPVLSLTFSFGEEPVLHTGAAATLWLTPA